MGKIIDTIIGDLSEKKEYKQTEARAKALPPEYASAYKDIRNYLFHTSGIVTMNPLKDLVDLLEEAAAENKRVIDVTGPDVAAFADELVRDESSYFDKERAKLNKSIADKSEQEEA